MIMPYLSFSGNCEEAFLWYAEIFGGKIQHMSKYGDIPENPNTPMSSQQKRKVMHAQLMLTENGSISGADALWPIESGGTVSIHAHLQNETLAQKVFSALSAGGVVLGELTTNPPPDDSGISGSVKDRYGFTWIISALKSI
ncbi:VOC family protein [Lacrimispora brassicae]